MGDRTLDYAYVRDDDIDGVQRVAFVRLVPAGRTVPEITVTANEAHVDLDGDGNIVGVTIFMDPTVSEYPLTHRP